MKINKFVKKDVFHLVVTGILCLSLIGVSGRAIYTFRKGMVKEYRYTVVIDPGHPDASLGTENKVGMGT